MANLINNVKGFSDETYFNTGIHFSSLQSVYNNNLAAINPKTKEELNAFLNEKEAIINGRAFEDYIEDAMAFEQKYYCFSADRSSNAMENTLADKLIEDDIDPNDVEKVASVIEELQLWKSDSKAKKEQRSQLDPNLKQYIIEHQYLNRLEEKPTVISSDARSAIVESSIVLNSEYSDLFNPKGDILLDEMQVIVELGELICKLDRILIYKNASNGKLYARVFDYKFKEANPRMWHASSYWKYGYWIQSVLYSHIVQSNLSEHVTFEGFWFVIGSLKNPSLSCVVEHPMEVNELMFQSSQKLPSVQELIEKYKWHLKNSQFDYPMEVYQNNKIFTPNLNFYLDFEE